MYLRYCAPLYLMWEGLDFATEVDFLSRQYTCNRKLRDFQALLVLLTKSLSWIYVF